MIFRIGIKGYLFAKIGQLVQQKLGARVGVTPGEDMKTSLILAKKNKSKLIGTLIAGLVGGLLLGFIL